MYMIEQFDVTVIGAGPGGAAAAKRAAKCGARVALIEKEFAGGTCLNWGCIPTKALLHSTHLFEDMQNAAHYGLRAEAVTFAYEHIAQRKDEIVEKLRVGNESGLRNEPTLSYFSGEAFITAPDSIRISSAGSDEVIKTEKIVIASGSRSRELPFLPFDGTRILDSKAFLALSSLPESLIIVGGGAIGCEFADMCNSLGVSVTVIEMANYLLPLEDHELGKRLALAFKKKGITVLTSDAIEDAQPQGSSMIVRTASGQELSADMILVAVGRVPNTDTIGIENLGLELDKGYIPVNSYCQTQNENVYAVGDVTTSPQLAHVAMQEGRITGYNVTHGNTIPVNYDVIPSCVFTRPEVASLGLTLDAAAKKGIEAGVAKELFSANGKAHCDGATEGFVKLVYDKKTGIVIGGQIMGASAADIICEVGLAVARKSTVRELAFTMHQHPTLSEAIQDAALNTFFSMGCFA
jgi:dihydrolipoamide dehydrogenase